MNATPLLEGYGVRLEPLSLAHVPALTRIALEPSSWLHMTVRLHSEADVQEWVETSLRTADTGAIEPWVTFVGSEAAGGTWFLDIQRPHRAVELGFTWLAAPWRGAGVNPRVKLLQMTYGFEMLGLKRIGFKTHHENLRSQAAMLKMGAQYEGTLRNHMVMPDGSSRHSKYYSVLDTEWPVVKARLLERIATEPLQKPQA